MISNIGALAGHTFLSVLVLRIDGGLHVLGCSNHTFVSDLVSRIECEGPVLSRWEVIATHCWSVQSDGSIISTLCWSLQLLNADIFVGDLHSLVLLVHDFSALFHNFGWDRDGTKILPGLILGGSLALNISSDAPNPNDEYWLISRSEEEDSPRMSIACCLWFLLWVCHDGWIYYPILPTNNDVVFIGSQVYSGHWGFFSPGSSWWMWEKGLWADWEPLGPDLVPYSICLIFSK